MYYHESDNPAPTGQLSNLSRKLILKVLYFEIFSYPLSFAEILKTINQTEVSPIKVNHALEELLKSGMIEKIQGYYLTKKRPDWIAKRLEYNTQATRYRDKALKRARLISYFPYVRGVFFSGSFSKGVLGPDHDVDFFIITKPNRLWLARTLLVLYKKIFLLNNRRFFCVNYFIDEDHLTIMEKNLFTATEIVTLLPAFGTKLYHQFMEANGWIKSYYPNYPLKDQLVKETPNDWVKQWLEQLFNSLIGEKLESLFFRNTIKYWNRKFSWMNAQTLDLALKSKKHISKHHPNNFQERVLRKYRFAIEEFEKLNQIKLRVLALP